MTSIESCVVCDESATGFHINFGYDVLSYYCMYCPGNFTTNRAIKE